MHATTKYSAPTKIRLLTGLLFFVGAILTVSNACHAVMPSEYDLEISLPGSFKLNMSDIETRPLLIYLERPSGKAAPRAEVANSRGDFNCRILKTSNIRSIAGIDGFLISVSWGSGTDLSGCRIEVKDTETLQKAVIRLSP